MAAPGFFIAESQRRESKRSEREANDVLFIFHVTVEATGFEPLSINGPCPFRPPSIIIFPTLWDCWGCCILPSSF